MLVDKGLASLLLESGVYGKRRTIPFFFVRIPLNLQTQRDIQTLLDVIQDDKSSLKLERI